jgi:hypothetical protein
VVTISYIEPYCLSYVLVEAENLESMVEHIRISNVLGPPKISGRYYRKHHALV